MTIFDAKARNILLYFSLIRLRAFHIYENSLTVKLHTPPLMVMTTVVMMIMIIVTINTIEDAPKTNSFFQMLRGKRKEAKNFGRQVVTKQIKFTKLSLHHVKQEVTQEVFLNINMTQKLLMHLTFNQQSYPTGEAW